MKGDECRIDGCVRQVTSKGRICNRCNYLKSHYGSYSFKPLTLTDTERFWNYVKKTDSCWIWGGLKNENNYGMGNLNRKQQRAHRISWELHNGAIPSGLFVCHKCDNPPCVNPEHLFLGTNLDNIKDRVAKGRSHRANAKLTPFDVFIIKDLIAINIPIKEIKSLFQVSRQAINDIKFNRRWASIINKYESQKLLMQGGLE